eukprot:CAMPEP_0119197360 /NCGR_PEP_ID=MMETSP1316-20130426/13709_1 /TAXON_ID=41880 /ORGANISM="Pycnococcus provasolii, Strain RCC2336" /LENGTH=180 /DNA_ID=CAMNT_0007193157 /DNA_START=46 /DNA_END=584 /DNA_ORIENTATION=+
MKAHVGENEVVKVEQIFTWQHAEDFEPWVPKYITPVAPYPGPTTHAVDDPSVYNNDVDKWSFDMSFADEDDDVGNRQPHYYKAAGEVAVGDGSAKPSLGASAALGMDKYCRATEECSPDLWKHYVDGYGHKCLFTPPYHPELQPIEKLWRDVKMYVARKFVGERNMKELWSQVLDGFRIY